MAAENKTGRDQAATVPALGRASVATVTLTRDTWMTGPSHSGGQRAKADTGTSRACWPGRPPRGPWSVPRLLAENQVDGGLFPRLLKNKVHPPSRLSGSHFTTHVTLNGLSVYPPPAPSHCRFYGKKSQWSPAYCSQPGGKINSRSHPDGATWSGATTTSCRPRGPPSSFNGRGSGSGWHGGVGSTQY